MVLERLEHHLAVNLEKCEFQTTSISYMSYVTSSGIQMDQEKARAVKDWLQSDTLKQTWVKGSGGSDFSEMQIARPHSSQPMHYGTIAVAAEWVYAQISEFNCTDWGDVLQRYYLTFMYSVEFAVGFLGNAVVILGYVFCLPAWKSTNVYLFNLAVSDLVFLCTFPRLAYNYANNQEDNSPFACITNRYILHMNLYSSILFMMWVSVDRLLLLRHPFRNHCMLSCKAAITTSVLTWLLVNILNSPLILYLVEDMKRTNWTKCHDFGSLSGGWKILNFSLGLTVTGYLLPLLALFASSQWAASVLKTQGEVFGTSYKRPLQAMRGAAIMFLVLYLPYHIMRNVRIASELPETKMSQCSKTNIEGLYIVTRPVAFAHNMIDPIFYFLMTEHFRELILRKLRTLRRRRATQLYLSTTM
ncbi:succinate receptor 1-like [Chanos chanos]|uniref:Succinate receptor 1-like n=1 Tax=Chanos chanos TaxID=29144 RepID=A0A6J2VPA1_CHACN|nr:succinate receptor 1-like [Chanos chanos]